MPFPDLPLWDIPPPCHPWFSHGTSVKTGDRPSRQRTLPFCSCSPVGPASFLDGNPTRRSSLHRLDRETPANDPRRTSRNFAVIRVEAAAYCWTSALSRPKGSFPQFPVL